MVIDNLGVRSVGIRLCTMPYVLFYVLWYVTTAIVGQKSKFGLLGAWDYSSYSYWFRNYGGTSGFCDIGSEF